MQLTPEALQNCAADVATLYRSYAPADWWIDRFGCLDFLDDQCVGHDRWQPAVFHAAIADMDRYGFHGYVI